MDTLNKIKEEIETEIETAKEKEIIGKLLVPILSEFEGKKITRRIGTRVNKLLLDYATYYEVVLGMYGLIMYRGNHKKYRVNIGCRGSRESSLIFTMKRFKSFNADLFSPNKVEELYQALNKAEEFYDLAYTIYKNVRKLDETLEKSGIAQIFRKFELIYNMYDVRFKS